MLLTIKNKLVIIALMFLSIMAVPSPTQSLINLPEINLKKIDMKQLGCMARNIYYEAGYEPRDGKIAVAMVTLNRVQDPQFPKDICSVVKQKTKSTCQFTWFCENKTLQNNSAYSQAQDIALLVYANYEKMQDMTQGALFYHADYVNPRWKLERTVVIGRHIFYKQRDGI